MTSNNPKDSRIVETTRQTMRTLQYGDITIWQRTIKIQTIKTQSTFDLNMFSRISEYITSWLASRNFNVHGNRYSIRICVLELI